LTGFWSSYDETSGPKPESRENGTMCCINGRIYIFGGLGRERINDTHVLDLEKMGWKNLIGIGPEVDVLNYSPTKRFGHTMCNYKEKFAVVFGGAGRFISKIKIRENFNDVRLFDVSKHKFINYIVNE
jgi:N-acetylneuraminic acid mutarotase